MPLTKSAKKALQRSQKLQERNLKFKLEMKHSIKSIRKDIAIASKAWEKVDEKKVNDMLVKAYSMIDKAARRNVVHKNNAARKKSRLTKLVNIALVAK